MKRVLLPALLIVAAPAMAAPNSDPLSMPADSYLAACDRGEADCQTVINIVLIYDSINPQASKLVCIPELSDDDAKMAAQVSQMSKDVIGWLHDHPSPKEWDANHAVGNAFGNLYPCKPG